MASIKELKLFDAAEYLDNDETVAEFLSAAMETGDPVFISHSLGVIARAKGIAKIALDTGLSREQLYRSFSENGNPTLRTMLSVMRSLGLELKAQPARKEKRGRRIGSRKRQRSGGRG